MSKKISEKKLLQKLTFLNQSKVSKIFLTPVNMLWLELEKDNLKFELIIDGLWLIEKNKEIVLINQDFHNESEKDFLSRLTSTIKSIDKKITRLQEICVDKKWGYIELIFDQDYVLLAKHNEFGFLGLNDLKNNKSYSITTSCNNNFFEEPLP